MDFGAAADESDDVIDLGLEIEDSGDDVIDLGASSETPLDESSVDFVIEDEEETGELPAAEEDDFAVTQESPTIEVSADDPTAEMVSPDDSVETPTIEEQFAGLDSTSELPSIPDPAGVPIAEGGQPADATAEINLDELGLDLDALDGAGTEGLDDIGTGTEVIDDIGTGTEVIDDLAETELASLDELDETELTGVDDAAETEPAHFDDDPLSVTSSQEELEDTSFNEALSEVADETGQNQELDSDPTGVQEQVSLDDTSIGEGLDIEEALSATSELRLAADETGQNPLMQSAIEEATQVDDSLLEATGRTQILPEDFAVDTGVQDEASISDDAETLLATLDDDDSEAAALGDEDATMLAPGVGEDFDFAKTEALPKDVFTGNMDLDETGEMPAVGSTSVDLDLDDLTAALKVSEMGDTVDMPRDDATVEHVRPQIVADDDTSEVATMSLSQDEMSDDLMEARTMTEVGTKLDLARAYVDMGDPGGARSILEEVLDEGDEGQRQQAQQLLDTLAG